MGRMIMAKIDLAKIDQEKIFHGKNGSQWVDVVLFENDEPDMHGNHWAIKQSQTKEEREAGVKVPYIGNAKNWGNGGNSSSGGRSGGASRGAPGYPPRSGGGGRQLPSRPPRTGAGMPANPSAEAEFDEDDDDQIPFN